MNLIRLTNWRPYYGFVFLIIMVLFIINGKNFLENDLMRCQNRTSILFRNSDKMLQLITASNLYWDLCIPCNHILMFK
jgi:hypothetical protein